MRRFKINLLQGVEGKSKPLTEKLIAESKYHAEAEIKAKFGNRFNSSEIDGVRIINTVEESLPDLTQSQIQNACIMFPNSSDPVNQYQLFLLNQWKD